MSIRKFAAAVKSGGLSESEAKWFPHWFERYVKWTGQLDAVTIEIRAEDLSPVRTKLEELAAREDSSERSPRNHVPKSDSTHIEVNDDKMLVGQIDPNEPALLQEMRKQMRRRHYAARSERSYTGWACRFAQFVGGWEKVSSGITESELKEFLSDLAVRGKVAASTQNQAFHALFAQCRSCWDMPM